MSHQLRVVSGPKAGHVVPLAPGQAVVIGRGAEAQLSVPEDNTLSRAHAEVLQEGGQWILRNKSQHGSLIAGQVFQDQRPLQPGAEFQVGGTKVVFEAAGAAAPAAAAAGGAPAAAAGGGGVPTKSDNSAAASALAGAGAAALGDLGSGPVKIDGSAEGFPLMDLAKGGVSVVKANLLPSLLLFAPVIGTTVINAILGFVMPAKLAFVGMIVSLVISLAGLAAQALVSANYVVAVRHYQVTGEAMGIGSLLKFEMLVPKLLIPLCMILGFYCFFVPGFLLYFAFPLYIDKPELGIGGAFKGSLAFVKRNIVPTILLMLTIGLMIVVGEIALCIGVFVMAPAAMATHWLAYECKRDEFAAAMAEDGVSA